MVGTRLSATDDGGSRSPVRMIVKNAAFLALAGGFWLALQTGYFSPDRPTRNQWEKLELAKKRPGGTLVYQSDFSVEKPGAATLTGTWGYYNNATNTTVTFGPSDIKINFQKAAWLGAVYHMTAFQPGAIYRVTMLGTVETEPGAMLVRNRQLDLTRKQIPVGSQPFVAEFVAPPGRFDRVQIVFMPDNRGEPKGRMTITSMKIERLGD